MKVPSLPALLGAASAKRVVELLGAGAALWKPDLEAGLGSPSRATTRPVQCPPLLIIAQGRTVASRLLRGAVHRGSRPIAVIVTARSASAQWLELATAAAELSPRPRLLVAIHRPTTLPALVELARLRLDLLPLGRATDVVVAPRLPALPLVRLGPALGWPVATGVAELLETAHLPPFAAPGRIVAIARTDDEAALLQDALGRQRIRARTVVQAKAGTALPRHDLLLLGPSCPLPSGPQTSAVRLTPPEPPLSVQIAALDARLRAAAAPALELPRSRPTSAEAREACLLLDTLRAPLGETDVRRLLALYRLPLSEAALVRSASAAGDATRALAPVTLRALGPERRGRPQPRVEGIATPARCKQAFRDLLARCRSERGPLEGILVERQLSSATGIEALLIWCEGLQLLWLRLRDDDLVAPCPRTRRAARALLGRLLPADRPQRSVTTAALAPLLVDLARLAAELAERMIWLHLPLITLPPPGQQPRIVGGFGKQRHSLRRPA